MESGHKPLSGDDFKIIGGGLVKTHVERKWVRIGIWATVSSLNFPDGSVKVDLLNRFYFKGFSILLLVRGMNRVSNLHPGALILVPLADLIHVIVRWGKKGYPVYDSAEFYVHKCKDLLIVGFDGF